MLQDIIAFQYPNNPRTKPLVWGNASFTSSWTMEAIDAPGAWLVPRSKYKPYVAVVDTGLNMAHQDLKGLDVISDPGLSDSDGHGTAVTGVFAARHGTGHGMAGVCPDVGVVFFVAEDHFWDRSYFGLEPRTTRVRKALETLVDGIKAADAMGSPMLPVRVLFVAKAGALPDYRSAQDASERFYREPVEKLLAAGYIVVLGAADGPVPAAKCVPTALKALLPDPALLSVSASEAPNFGLWERNAMPCYPGQDDVDVWAPGGPQVTLGAKGLTAYNELTAAGLNFNYGNSLAMPHVAGLAALLLEIDPTLTAAETCGIIRKTSDVQGFAGYRPYINVINAFAAALNAYNRKPPDEELLGYRVMIPSELDFSGTGVFEQLEGAELELTASCEPGVVKVPFACVHHLGTEYAFCRFTAPASVPLRARLLVPRTLAGNQMQTQCLWQGRLEELSGAASPASSNTVWAHPNCPHLKTLRLQGLALPLCYAEDGTQPVQNAKVELRSRQTSYVAKCVTGADGMMRMPFVEPGDYDLIATGLARGPDRFARLLKLEEGRIYLTDPKQPTRPCIHVAPTADSGQWFQHWAGSVRFAGSAAKYRPTDGWPFWDSYAGELFQASGTVTFTAEMREITKPLLLEHCFEAMTGGDMSWAEWAEEWGEFPDDEMPNLSAAKVRVFSEALARLEMDKSVADRQPEIFALALEESVLDWNEHQMPPGFLIGSDLGGAAFGLDFAALSRRMIEARFALPSEFEYPFPIDLSFGCYLDFPNYPQSDENTGYELCLAMVQRFISPALIPWKREPIAGHPNRWRVFAGPAEGSRIEFLKSPASPLCLLADDQPCPPRCASIIVEEPEVGDPSEPELAEIFLLSERGEVGHVRRWDYGWPPPSFD